MKRRKFIYATAAAGIAPIATYGNGRELTEDPGKELYEIRTYEAKFGGDQSVLKEYLQNTLGPALKRLGANFFKVFSELGNSDPANFWVVISYPDAATFIRSTQVHSDPGYQAAAESYNALTPDKALYNRISSSLLRAFDGMPKMVSPAEWATVFELRTYEGFNEDAVRRKIQMFNDEEIIIFLKVRLPPVFFGEMIIGSHRPCLTYMLNFKDMAEHDSSWNTFREDPEWKEINGRDIYANTVSNIRKVFLKSL